jgi:hypothetical protein
VHGRAGGRPFTQVVALGEPEPQVGARQQWVARELATLTDKPAIVELSVAHSVLAKHTALLVLESEEAYERYAIERRTGLSRRRSRIRAATSTATRTLSRPRRPAAAIGDPHPGPARSCRSRSCSVRREQSRTLGGPLGQWTVRFLVDDDTDRALRGAGAGDPCGRTWRCSSSSTGSTSGPQLRLELRAEDGAYDICPSGAERGRCGARADRGATGEGKPRRSMRVAWRLIMPDGQTLNRQGWGDVRAALGAVGCRQWPAMVTVVV